MSFEPLFDLRYRVARLGEDDWMRWWTSYALSPTGAYLVPRLFRRTPRVSAAHLAIGAARVRHNELLPREPRVHLFDFGEAVEGEFERWLIERKASGWEPEPLPAPTPDARAGTRAALALVGVDPDELPPATAAVPAAGRGYAPDLDDGVVISAALLHRVIPWGEPARVWKELEAGKYDWAKLAMALWPERVREKCATDKSLAIAHGLA